MNLEKIKLIQFRNYSRLELKDFANVNLLIGENASGKTNFLEAISLLSSAMPLRRVLYRELVEWGHDYFFLSGEFSSGSVEVGYSEKKRSLKFNGDKIKRDELCFHLPAVSFLPSDLCLVTGTPADKRNFLDSALLLTRADYAQILSRYTRTLAQRNAMLKSQPARAVLYDSELVKWGTELIRARLSLIPAFNQTVSGVFQELYGKPAQLRYFNNFRVGENLQASFETALKKGVAEERRRGYTLTGPHRDTAEIVGEHEKTPLYFASQGQQRALSVALKTGLLRYIERVRGEKPLLLIDDVLLEIDSARRERLFETLLSSYQCFITLTSRSLLPISDCAVFEVGEGTVKRVR